VRDLANVGFGYGLVRKYVWIEKLCLSLYSVSQIFLCMFCTHPHFCLFQNPFSGFWFFAYCRDCFCCWYLDDGIFVQNINESFDLCDSPINLHFLDLKLLAITFKANRVSYHIAIS
jgi:hypothetical protein